MEFILSTIDSGEVYLRKIGIKGNYKWKRVKNDTPIKSVFEVLVFTKD